jgi:DNA/RNA-binding domain of Phe-tRNA-synthetase-like protein
MKLLDLIKSKRQKFEEAAAVVENFATATTAAGVEIYWEGDLGEGVAVVMASEGEEMVPAPAGEHQVNDQIVTLDENGVVVSIVPIEAEMSADEQVAEAIAEMGAELTAVKNDFAAVKAELEATKVAFEAFKKSFPETKTETVQSAPVKRNPFLKK